MKLMIYKSWQRYCYHCQAWQFIFAWRYCPSLHTVNNSLIRSERTHACLTPFQPPYPSVAQILFILMVFLYIAFWALTLNLLLNSLPQSHLQSIVLLDSHITPQKGSNIDHLLPWMFLFGRSLRSRERCHTRTLSLVSQLLKSPS